MFQEYLCQKSNEDDAKLSYEVAHRLILKLAEYVTEKAANPVKVSRNIMINQNLPKLQIVFERDNLFESFVVVSLFPIDSEYESVMPQTGVITKLFLFHMKKTDQKFSNLLKLL